MRFRWTGLLIAIAAACGIVAYVSRTPLPPSTKPVAIATTTSSKPTTVAVAPPPPKSVFEALKRENPKIAATQPLGVPVDFGEAARFVIDKPIFLDNAGHLWLSHPDAEPLAAVLKPMARTGAPAETTHLVRETVAYVFWMTVNGKFVPAVFTRGDAGGIQVTTPQGKLALPAKRSFHFARALPMADFVAIPCDDGVSVLTIGKTSVTEQFVALPASKDAFAQPQVISGVRGLLAWTPATAAQPGSGVWRFIDGAWSQLPEVDWPTSIVHLSPFLDGTVQQLRQADGGRIDLAAVLLDTPQVDEKRIESLIDELGEMSESKRTAATEELQRMGPSAWAVMRKFSTDQLPEIQQRLEMLLAGANTPSLGAMQPINGKLKVLTRHDDAGLLLYSDVGVSIPQPDKETTMISPAWIAMRPGRTPELLPDMLVADLKPESANLVSIDNEWYRTDAIDGPRRFVGNGMLSMLRKSERKFYEPVGSDRRGRWLFREPGKESPTLLIDPTIQDPTPRLPVWTIRVKAGAVGWNKDGWPAIKRGGAWELRETGWKAMDEAQSPLLNKPFDRPKPATMPADGEPLLTDSLGRKIYDGTERLTIVSGAAKPQFFELPATASGVDPVTLIEAKDKKVFLFNQPGRVVRLSRGDGNELFSVDEIFSRNIPNEEPVRIWLDPAGRICMASKDSIAVLFPSGVIPQQILTKMSVEELRANEPE